MNMLLTRQISRDVNRRQYYTGLGFLENLPSWFYHFLSTRKRKLAVIPDLLTEILGVPIDKIGAVSTRLLCKIFDGFELLRNSVSSCSLFVF